jgi:conjugative transfer signal peptidase TraF
VTRGRGVTRLLVPLGALLLVAGWPAHQDFLPVGITWIRSPSLPIGLYWHTRPTLPPRRGDVVCFRYHAPQWAIERQYLPEDSLVCKRVLGLSGDRLVRNGDSLTVCHPAACEDVGRIVSFDSRGRPVTPAMLPERIPEGSVYLGVPEHPRSFDSRYLGLVQTTQLLRTIHSVWVRTQAEETPKRIDGLAAAAGGHM